MNSTNMPSLPQPATIASDTAAAAILGQLTEADLAHLRASLTRIAQEREMDVLGWYQALPRLKKAALP